MQDPSEGPMPRPGTGCSSRCCYTESFQAISGRNLKRHGGEQIGISKRMSRTKTKHLIVNTSTVTAVVEKNNGDADLQPHGTAGALFAHHEARVELVTSTLRMSYYLGNESPREGLYGGTRLRPDAFILSVLRFSFR